jgi:hypothetical protein
MSPEAPDPGGGSATVVIVRSVRAARLSPPWWSLGSGLAAAAGLSWALADNAKVPAVIAGVVLAVSFVMMALWLATRRQLRKLQTTAISE